LYQELGNKIEALDGGFSLKDIVEKKMDFLLMRGIP
jgi:hypothetical protein